MANRIVIAAVGLITPVGLKASQTCASVRAGLSRFKEFLWKDKNSEPFVMAAIPEQCLPDLRVDDKNAGVAGRMKRLLQIAVLALDEINQIPSNIPLILGLPENKINLSYDLDEFLDLLCHQTKLPVDLKISKAFANGRASGLIAVHEAYAMLEAGKEEFVLVGGVDSYMELYIMGRLDAASRIKTGDNLDGFIPGEGAGFLLITTERTAQVKKLPVLCYLNAVETSFEDGHLYSEKAYRGDGLAGTFQKLFSHNNLPTKKIKTVYSGMNGEHHWAKEWGVAFMRFQDKIEHEFVIEHPADCFGDLGAAIGPIMIGIAAKGLQKGYTQGPVLIYCSSDKGESAASIMNLG